MNSPAPTVDTAVLSWWYRYNDLQAKVRVGGFGVKEQLELFFSSKDKSKVRGDF